MVTRDSTLLKRFLHSLPGDLQTPTRAYLRSHWIAVSPSAYQRAPFTIRIFSPRERSASNYKEAARKTGLLGYLNDPEAREGQKYIKERDAYFAKMQKDYNLISTTPSGDLQASFFRNFSRFQSLILSRRSYAEQHLDPSSPIFRAIFDDASVNQGINDFLQKIHSEYGDKEEFQRIMYNPIAADRSGKKRERVWAIGLGRWKEHWEDLRIERNCETLQKNFEKLKTVSAQYQNFLHEFFRRLQINERTTRRLMISRPDQQELEKLWIMINELDDRARNTLGLNFQHRDFASDFEINPDDLQASFDNLQADFHKVLNLRADLVTLLDESYSHLYATQSRIKDLIQDITSSEYKELVEVGFLRDANERRKRLETFWVDICKIQVEMDRVWKKEKAKKWESDENLDR